MPTKLLSDIRQWFWPDQDGVPPEEVGIQPALCEPAAAAPFMAAMTRLPLAFVVDDEESVCRFVARALAANEVTTRCFQTAGEAVAALSEGLPAIIFLDVALKQSDAIDVIRGLGQHGFTGPVQLMSGSDIGLLEDVRRVGERHGLEMLAPLQKPFRPDAVRRAVLEAKLKGRAVTVVDLPEAQRQGWLELWYQPKIDLRSKTFAGAEGLIRCRHPELGVLAPASFLPDASESAMRTLTEYVMLTALRDWDELAAAGVFVHIAVNSSAGALANPDLPALIRAHKPKSEKWPGLILEVTESEVVKDVALMHEIATQLRIYGIALAIDDFGEGYSSFARLRELPFAELKLDRSFVTNCAADARNAGICQTIVELAHHFGCVAVAEGIERPADLQAVHRMGCDLGQGFLLGRQRPKAQLMALLRERIEQQQAS
jgi:EAL domain-containing protein (putative c-di-GMP-specific phosphodiesterase class I)/FixJ family two-component response regulator